MVGFLNPGIRAQLMSVASNGLEALEKIRKVARTDGKREGQMFDCVLMDLEMPGKSTVWTVKYFLMPVMDGLTALGHIRQEEQAGSLAHNLVIALSKSRLLCWGCIAKKQRGMPDKAKLMRRRRQGWTRSSSSRIG